MGYTPKYLFHKPKRRGKTFLCALVILCLVGFAAVSVVQYTLAYLSSQDTKTNVFVVGNASSEIDEIFSVDEKKKEDVKVVNTGNIPVYVRAFISVYWVTTDGKTILQEEPQPGVDYSISINNTDWVKDGNDFYYHKAEVLPGTASALLIESCVQTTSYADRYLVVDILSQSIQAYPETAVESVWPVKVEDDGCLDLEAAVVSQEGLS